MGYGLAIKQIAAFIGWAGVCCMFAACEEKQDPYPGFSNMVAERHEVRKAISREKEKERERDQAAGVKDQPSSPPAPDRDPRAASTLLYEKQVEITDAVTRKPIARAIAYLDRDGQIVRIRIIRQ
jgi:hypothetical protein